MSNYKERLAANYGRMARASSSTRNNSIRKALGLGDFLNYGYWTPGITDWQSACEALLEKLLSHLPDKSGLILDVGCGLGANAQYLLKYYPADQIIGINISSEQINYCKNRVPGASFEVMQAEKLAFQDESIDNIICVEAAHHFDTRLDFFREAHRVLKPGGKLVLSDVFADVEARGMPSANRVATVEGYRDVLLAAGFGEVVAEDATQQSVMRRTEVVWTRLRRLFDEGEINQAAFESVRNKLMAHRRLMSYVLAAATKS